MAEQWNPPEPRPPTSIQLARMVLFVFLITFIATRLTVFLIMSRRVPDLYLHMGGSHIHHLNYGIFLLAGLGAYLLFRRPQGQALKWAATLYGVGMALTFDEFGMWVRLGGSYWQRASVDAVGVLAALFALIAYAPSFRKFRPRHWWSAIVLALAVTLFFIMLTQSFRYAGRVIGPKLYQIETRSPPQAFVKVPGPYSLAFLIFLVLLGGRAGPEQLLDLANVPILPAIVLNFVSLYGLTVEMRILGVLYRRYQSRLGWFR